MKSYALLSVRNHPILKFLLQRLEIKDALPKAIIFDQKYLSKEDINRYCERTGYQEKELEFFKENSIEIPVFDVNNHNDIEVAEIIDDINIDFLVNAGTPRILKNKIIKKTKFGILNCHPGILPEFKGCSCVEWSIFYDKTVGNTIHWIDSGIDSGPIIEKKVTKCFKSDDYTDIRKRVYFDGFELLAELIEKISLYSENNFEELYKGSISDGGNYYKPIDKELLEIVKNKVKQNAYKFQNEPF